MRFHRIICWSLKKPLCFAFFSFTILHIAPWNQTVSYSVHRLCGRKKRAPHCLHVFWYPCEHHSSLRKPNRNQTIVNVFFSESHVLINAPSPPPPATLRKIEREQVWLCHALLKLPGRHRLRRPIVVGSCGVYKSSLFFEKDVHEQCLGALMVRLSILLGGGSNFSVRDAYCGGGRCKQVRSIVIEIIGISHFSLDLLLT
jgi:hypothetical protein